MTDDTNNNIVDDLIGLFDDLHIQFPDEHNKRIAASCILHSEFYKEAELYCPRLYITSATRGCGKSTLLTIISKLAHEGIKIALPTAATMFTMIEKKHPTLCIEEISTFYQQQQEDTAAVTGILLEGADPDGSPVYRLKMPERKLEPFNTYGPVVFAGKDRGNIPEDVLDRAFEIRLKRRSGAKPPRLTRQQKKALIDAVSEKLDAFVERMKDRIGEVLQPSIPQELLDNASDRFVDKAEAFIIINDLVDLDGVPAVPVSSVSSACSATPPIGINGHKMRQAAIAYLKKERENVEDETDHRILILYHFQDMFDKFAVKHNNQKYLLPTMAVEVLNKMEDAPWYSYNDGTGITVKQGLKKLLKVHDIKQHKVRIPKPTNVYLEDDFKAAFKSYPRPTGEEAEQEERIEQERTERYKTPVSEPLSWSVPYTSKPDIPGPTW